MANPFRKDLAYWLFARFTAKEYAFEQLDQTLREVENVREELSPIRNIPYV